MNNKMFIPVIDRLVLPGLFIRIPEHGLTRQENEKIRSGETEVILGIVKDEKSLGSKDISAFRALGVLARLTRTGMTGEGKIYHFEMTDRINLLELREEDGLLIAGYTLEANAGGLEPEEEKDIISTLQGMLMERAPIRDQKLVKLSAFAGFMDNLSLLGWDDRYALLQTDSLKEQGMILKGIIEMLPDTWPETPSNAQKENEARTRSGKKDYRRLIEESGMSDDVREEIEEILTRYEEMQKNDPERSSIENYLDFMTSLKWKIDDPKVDVDLKKARAILDRDHYGLDKVKERILQQIAVMSLKQQQAGSILLLIGPPGTGKTSMGKSIAETLGRKYVRVSLGGVRDEAEIRGHRRTYVGAMPGRIMDGMKKAGSMNPVMVLDEVDKLSLGYQGDPASALLEVLDPEQNNTFTDHYMNVPYDLSNVFFICTANSLQGIPGPLLDRMEVITLSGYTPGEKQQIAWKYLFPRALEDAGLKSGQIELSEDALTKVIEEYTMEAGVRGLKKQLDILCRHTAAQIVEEGDEKVEITPDNLNKFLGNKRVIHDRALKSDQVGVVTGLAWTAAGGEILFIETRRMKGHGQMVLTGQLGDVMKESATISLSLVRSLFEKECENFSEQDIHIHVPSGSVPKDGPSAGVTMFTALASLVTGTPVSCHLAMTGEISLRGQVMPIGGLPEKLLAADRAGIQKVLIPEGNVQDLEDVPEETRRHLNIVPVSTVKDVLREALGMEETVV